MIMIDTQAVLDYGQGLVRRVRFVLRRLCFGFPAFHRLPECPKHNVQVVKEGSVGVSLIDILAKTRGNERHRCGADDVLIQ